MGNPLIVNKLKSWATKSHSYGKRPNAACHVLLWHPGSYLSNLHLLFLTSFAYIARVTCLLCLLICCTSPAQVKVISVPPSLQSDRFKVTIDGKPAAFINAAANYYALSLDLKGKAKIAITAPDAAYWARGVEVQPWRENIRPVRLGPTITFTLDHPAKLSIARPGDHLGGAEMIFLFANAPEPPSPSPRTAGIRYYGPGIYHEDIDARSGDRIYLAPGAVVFGSLNFWNVEDVQVFGRGTIIHDGPQDPNADEGWMQRKNWHVIAMHNARRVTVSGITCIVRSRTWMIQMRDSNFITFDNVKVIGGSSGNANQDGMDWLGGGDTLVHDVFIRAADDIFAMQGNWEGYEPDAISIPGHTVNNITIDKSVLSTSISNVVRLGWPRKIFDSNNFTMRDSDVIHMGSGGCGIPFALFEIWSDPDGSGNHNNILFDDVRLESWYSLVQIQQAAPQVHQVTFRNIWAPELPAMVPSTLSGSVTGVNFDHVKIANHVASTPADLQLLTSSGASMPIIDGKDSMPHAEFAFSPTVVRPRHTITFDASASTAPHARIVRYEWFFGDGTSARGRIVRHALPDDQGTLQDGSGRFRVMLKITDQNGRTDWATHPVMVTNTLHPALTNESVRPGLKYAYYLGSWTTLPKFDELVPVTTGVTENLTHSMHPQTASNGLVFAGFISIPSDGGYSFTVISRDGARVTIDGTTVAKAPSPWPQVCGSVGNSVQAARGTIGLSFGLHTIRLEATHADGDDAFDLLWEGPNIQLDKVPDSILSHHANVQ